MLYSYAVLGIKVEPASLLSMPTVFNFLACVTVWDGHPALRKRARSQQILLLESHGRKHISPTLNNISLNKLVLKPFTEIMATHGLIRKSLSLVTQAIQAFYQQELCEEHSKDPLVLAKMDRAAKKSAKIIKSMLTSVKRKWARWEMPRDSFFAYGIPFVCLYVCMGWGERAIFHVGSQKRSMRTTMIDEHKDAAVREMVLDLAKASSKAYEDTRSAESRMCNSVAIQCGSVYVALRD